MPSNKKKKGNKKKKADSSSVFSFNADRQTESTMSPPLIDIGRAEQRPVPDMTVHPGNMKHLLLELPNKHRTATAKRFMEAYELVDSIPTSPPPRQRQDCPIDELIQDNAVFKKCAHLLRAVELTDMRVAMSVEVIKGFVMPDCWSSVTELRPINNDDVEPQLARLSAKCFVVLTATCVVLSCMGYDHPALALAHELRLHDEQHYNWLDWEDLEEVNNNNNSDDTTPPLDQATLRFVLATVGIKAARRLYRERDTRQAFPDSKPVSSKTLLDSMEAFAHDQCKFRPQNGVGWWNLAYIAQQAVAKRGMDPLTGTAECLAMLRKCIAVADEADDDFLKACGRIEAAMCLVLGGEGIVAYTVLGGEPVQVKRDFCETDAEKEAEGGVKFYTTADTDEIRAAIMKNETRRLEAHVPPTTLEPGEDLLVPRWEVIRLWNEAMKGPYDSLERWGHHVMVYGETCGWDIVAEFLKFTRNYAPTQFGVAPDPPGFPKERDKGFAYTQFITCANCGKRNESNRLCSRCQNVSYCSRECQVAHWKTHKPSCKKKTDAK